MNPPLTDHPEKFAATSMDLIEEQKAKLKSLFPEIMTEGGKIDFERLKLTLGEAVDTGKERYGMNWPGKADCFQTIQKPSMGTLVPCPKESVNFETTENLIIEGDNLEVLKLLQKSYLGKVKMIYIDPPYNTGNDFIYPDNYSESLETYLRYTGQADAEGRKYSTNTEADGRFHSKWLNMMYPRLFLARNLLREDGVIFISIDDNEVTNLRKLCDELFGEENFVSTIVWEKRYSPQNAVKWFSESHDFIVVYAKNKLNWHPHLLERSDEMNARYRNPDNDSRGVWKPENSTAQGGHGTKSQFYVLTAPNGKQHTLPNGRCWVYTEPVFEQMIADNRIWFGADGNNVPAVKRFLSEVKQGTACQTIWKYSDVGHNQEGKKEVNDLFPESTVFETPKPVRLIERMVQISSSVEADDLILDFFAGSATTGHAVAELNAKDGGSRKFILVQLPEPTERQDFPTIADITKERVRRVIKKLNDEDAGKLDLENNEKKPDRGFKVFKLQSSNFTAWNPEQPKDEVALATQLALHVDHLVAGRTQEDVLYELLLKSGFQLDTKIERIILAEKTVFSIAEGTMLICLEEELTPEVIKAMAEKKPQRVVCLDAGFANNDQLKTNAVQTMKARGVVKFQTV